MTDVLRLMGEAQGLKFSHQDVSRDGSEGKAFCVLKCKPPIIKKNVLGALDDFS
jgi:hypothetical protein